MAGGEHDAAVIGDRVGVSYDGKGTAAPGMNAPERYRLLVDRPKGQEQPIDWDTVAAPVDEEPAAAEAADDDTSFDIPF